MKVLWFEISKPSEYDMIEGITLGWQDALEHIIRNCQDVELFIAFESENSSTVKKKDNVTYIPIKTKYTRLEKKMMQLTWSVNIKKLLPCCHKIIKDLAPDIIHVFGNEWPFGLLAEITNIPVVVHIQGSIIPYNNALFPPGYNWYTMLFCKWYSPIIYWRQYKRFRQSVSNQRMEEKIWSIVHYYMGRTHWDYALCNVLQPQAHYYHVEEALRPAFMNSNRKWVPVSETKIKLITTGMSNFWKGPDMLLKTAHILKKNGVNFEWVIAGNINSYIKQVVEKKEKKTFEDNNVKILGFVNSEKLVDLLCSSTLYIHTAYIENSPNSICEAQYVGIPVISTNVGGIATLLDNGKDGVLVPSNDPWQLAYAIINLSNNLPKMLEYSNNSYNHAHFRHSPQNIKNQLLNCYSSILDGHTTLSEVK